MPLNSLPFVIPNRFSGEESALPQPGCPGLAIFETWETKSSGALARRFDVGSLACMFRKIRVRVRLQAYRKWHVVNRAFRRSVKIYHTDPAPVGRHSESQRPATFTHHGTHHCAMSSWP